MVTRAGEGVIRMLVRRRGAIAEIPQPGNSVARGISELRFVGRTGGYRMRESRIASSDIEGGEIRNGLFATAVGCSGRKTDRIKAGSRVGVYRVLLRGGGAVTEIPGSAVRSDCSVGELGGERRASDGGRRRYVVGGRVRRLDVCRAAQGVGASERVGYDQHDIE